MHWSTLFIHPSFTLYNTSSLDHATPALLQPSTYCKEKARKKILFKETSEEAFLCTDRHFCFLWLKMLPHYSSCHFSQRSHEEHKMPEWNFPPSDYVCPAVLSCSVFGFFYHSVEVEATKQDTFTFFTKTYNLKLEEIANQIVSTCNHIVIYMYYVPYAWPC